LALSEVAERFARFREEHPKGTRVPGDLRAAALAALREGATPGELHRACGVSWSQTVAWNTERRTAPAKRGRTAAEDVRVFSVVDEQPARQLEPTVSVGHELELRLGPWSVSVRLAEPTPAGRG
jgi:hypothetical protein